MPEAWEWDPGVEVFKSLSCWSQAHPQSGDTAAGHYFSSRVILLPRGCLETFLTVKTGGVLNLSQWFFSSPCRIQSPKKRETKGNRQENLEFLLSLVVTTYVSSLLGLYLLLILNKTISYVTEYHLWWGRHALAHLAIDCEWYIFLQIKLYINKQTKTVGALQASNA